MSPALEGRRAHVVMGCRALARTKTLLRRPRRDEPIMIANSSKPASERVKALGRVGSGKPLPGICVSRLWLGFVATLLRIYTPRPLKGSADILIAGLWESRV